ncbi:hypothetical protein COLO4_33371 [Corchorus olitorius]|uniref:Prolamin-like domain-containing protein n=1 Tax=Corchorus olitorius TaxID=93759 RepID=A0A1R3GUD2_9ROSI|nr:hypothetical protein COLO4_33371 [Corchorus olitorius]
MEIFTSLFRCQIGIIGPTCCRAIAGITNNCWPKMFPLTPFFAPLLRASCSSRLSGANMNDVNKLSVPGLLPYVPGHEIKECWSPLTNVKDCVFEIFRSLRGNRIGHIGPGCCKAIVNVSDSCWTKLFPLNPFFPPLLKNSCIRVAHAPAVPAAPKP